MRNGAGSHLSDERKRKAAFLVFLLLKVHFNVGNSTSIDVLSNQLRRFLKVNVHFETDACDTFQKSRDRRNLGLIAMQRVEIRR